MSFSYVSVAQEVEYFGVITCGVEYKCALLYTVRTQINDLILD